MAWSTLPLHPSDDGWPYPDLAADADVADSFEVDLDALELRADPHAFDGLSTAQRAAVTRHFGLDGGPALSMKELGRALGCSRAEAREQLGLGIDKLRTRLQVD